MSQHYADPYLPLLNGQELALSFMTVAELFQWAILRQWGARRLSQLEQHLSNYLVIPVDQALCQEWSQVRADRQSAGRPISPQDAWIAATVLRYDLPLVTHNIKDFQEISTSTAPHTFALASCLEQLRAALSRFSSVVATQLTIELSRPPRGYL